MALESVAREGCILFRGEDNCNIDSIGISFLKSAARSCFLSNQAEQDIARRWNLTQDSYKMVRLNCSSTQESILVDCGGFSICLIDSIDFLIGHFGLDQTASLLQKLKTSSCVIALCPSGTVNLPEWKRLHYVADAYFVISINGKRCVSQSVIYKRNGKTIRMNEEISISPELKLTSKKFLPCMEEKILNIKSADDSLSTPFDMGLHLKESERNARAALQLPYMSAINQEGLVGLRSSEKKVRVGGQVIYTPDDGDDLDDSDPDDDLNL